MFKLQIIYMYIISSFIQANKIFSKNNYCLIVAILGISTKLRHWGLKFGRNFDQTSTPPVSKLRPNFGPQCRSSVGFQTTLRHPSRSLLLVRWGRGGKEGDMKKQRCAPRPWCIHSAYTPLLSHVVCVPMVVQEQLLIPW